VYILAMMSNNSDTPTTYTRKRTQGKRPTKQENIEAQEKFLASFAENANISASCRMAVINRSLFYEWQEHDETFSMRFKVAEQEANDVIRAELFRRGVQGYEKPVVSMGKVVYGPDGKLLTENVYSDMLLSFLAKARMPEFRDKQQIEVNNVSKQRDRELHDKIMKILDEYPEVKWKIAEVLNESELEKSI
jgi:hypothetical protein